MGMKPRLEDSFKDIPGTVTKPKKVTENTNIPNTVTTTKTEIDHPIHGTVTSGGGMKK